MIRLIALGLIAIVATLGGGYAAIMLGGDRMTAAKSANDEHLEFVKIEPVSVPIIRSGKVEGYVIAHVTVSAKDKDAEANRAALTTYASEAVFRAIYEEEEFNFAVLKPMEVVALSDRIVKLANERIGRATIRHSVIENLNFVSSAELRSR
ncbi:MAG: hypothetical protein AB7O43_04360 [Hyphomicrobiaceae bacterium]